MLLIAILSPPKPKEFKSETGAFSVAVPTLLESTVQSRVLPAVGKVDFHLFEGKRGNTSYFVGYMDFPEDLIKQAASNPSDVYTLLHNSRDGSARGVNGKLISSSDITLGSNLGVEFITDAVVGVGQQMRAKQQIYLVGNRLYMLGFAGSEFGFNDEEANRYLHSFKLLVK